jgi:hypothetical protein
MFLLGGKQHNNAYMVVGAILFIGLFLLYFGYSIFGSIRIKNSFKKFIEEHNFVVSSKPDNSSEIPRIFYNETKQIPFDKITNLIEASPTFKIFTNSYIGHGNVLGSNQLFRRGSQRFNVSEKQLCFLFKIKNMKGYHKVYNSNAALKLQQTALDLITNQSSSKFKYVSSDFEKDYLFLSNNQGELKEVIQKLKESLIKIINIFNEEGLNEVAYQLDGVPSNLQIHLTRGWVLIRIPCELGYLINPFYNIFAEIQKKLS